MHTDKQIVLRGDNYDPWRYSITTAIEDEGLEDYVLEVMTDIEQAVSDSKKWKKAKRILTQSIDEKHISMISHCKTARDIWLCLERFYHHETGTNTQALLAKFHNFKINSLSELSSGLSEFQTMVSKLKTNNVVLDDNLVGLVMLNALPKCFDNFRSVWKLTNDDYGSLAKITKKIYEHVEELESNEQHAMAAIKTTRYNNKNKGRHENKPRDLVNNDICKYCKKVGHWARDCRKLKRKKEQEQTSNNYNRSTHRPTYRPQQSQDGAVNFMAITGSQPMSNKNHWIADSGCSAHMTSQLDIMTNYRKFPNPTNVRLGDDHRIQAEGSGIIITTSGNLNNVYYVPELGANLFSITAATSQGVVAVCTADSITFQHNGKPVLKGHKTNGVYILKLEPTSEIACNRATLDEWHQRFGHTNKETIKLMKTNQIVRGMDIVTESKDTCVDCAINKCHRVSHPSRSTIKATHAGAALHMDTITVNIRSTGDANYALLCKDEYSSYRMIACVPNKAQIPEEAKLMLTRAEAETGNQVLQLTSDNGTEFTSQRLTNFLQTKGILHRLSAPYTPQQNGMAEREIRTIVESARTLINKAKLPKELWAEAVKTATYALNRTINSKSQVTPYQLWFGTIPNVKNLRIFGQRAIVLKLGPGKSKFDTKGDEVVFVGYTDTFNTYKFYNPTNRQIITSCNATFLNSIGLPITTQHDDSNHTTYVVFSTDEENQENSEINITEEPIYANLSCSRSVRSEAFCTANQSLNPAATDDMIMATDENDQISQPSAETIEAALTENSSESTEDIPTQVAPTSTRSSLRKGLARINYKLLNSGKGERKSKSIDSGSDQNALMAVTDPDEPNSYYEAIHSSNGAKWKSSCDEEMSSFYKNNVWELVDRPLSCNIVSNRWIFKIKRRPNGAIDRYRARLVARGFSQRHGVDYLETYAPVADMVSIRFLFAYAAKKRLFIAQFDIKTAFLYGELDEKVFMEQPEGYEINENQVCLLKRSIYGLKQAPRQWNRKFKEFLTKMQLETSKLDQCIFYRTNPLLIIAIYVDDGIIFAESQNIIQTTLSQLKTEFEVHSVSADIFLGFQYHRDEDGNITLHQESYIQRILRKFNMDQANAYDTPISISKASTNEEPLDPETPYREAVGSLMYAAVLTRLDIAFAVGKASRKVSNPTVEDWTAIKRIFRYLREKENLGITYKAELNQGLIGYCDADFAGDFDTAKSTTGYVFLYAGGPIAWKSKRQTQVTTSSTEAECVSLCATAKEAVWIKNLGTDLKILDTSPTPIYCDNRSAIMIATNEKSAHRTRHMSVQMEYAREQVTKEEISISHVKSEDQLADILTKPTTTQKFICNRDKLLSKPTLLALMAILTSLMLGNVNAIINLEKVKPLIWLPTENYVETQINDYDLTYVYSNPCSQLKVPDSIKNSTEYNVMQSFGEKCEEVYRNKWIPLLQQLEQLQPQEKQQLAPTLARKKREFFTIAIMVLATVVVTNIVKTLSISGKVTRLDERAKQQEELIRRLQMSLDLQRSINQDTAKGLEKLFNITRKHTEQIDQLTELLPKLTWDATAIHSAFDAAFNDLNYILAEYANGRVACKEMARLMNITNISRYRRSQTIFDSVTHVSENTLNMKFSLTDKSKDTFIYRVGAFSYLENLLSEPILVEYAGSEYLIHNKTNNCVKAIEQPRQIGIQEECTEKDRAEPRLTLWTRKKIQLKDPRMRPQPTVHRTLKHNFIYCYTHNITIEEETIKCPAHAFKLPTTTSFETAGIRHTSTNRTGFARLETTAIDDIHPRYLNETDYFDSLDLIDHIRKVNEQIAEMNTQPSLSLIISKFSPMELIITSTIFLSSLLLIIIIIVCCSRKEPIYSLPLVPKGSGTSNASSEPPLPPKKK